MTTGAFPRWLSPAAGYLIVEPTTGVLRAVPWSWLGAVALASGGRAAWRHSRAGGPEAALDRAARARLWCIASFVIAAAASLAPTMTWFGTTMRYLGDATPGLLLLSTMGAGALVDEAGQGKRPRRIAIAFCLVLAGATMIMGLLLGMEGYYASFKVNNPALYAKLVAKLSLCGR
jgi:hypothetical protein